MCVRGAFHRCNGRIIFLHDQILPTCVSFQHVVDAIQDHPPVNNDTVCLEMLTIGKKGFLQPVLASRERCKTLYVYYVDYVAKMFR